MNTEPCDLCPDPTCRVRPGSTSSAYHWLEMLRDAYVTNGTPRTDGILMGLAHTDEMAACFGPRLRLVTS